MLEFLNKGLLTTVQDQGRLGYQRYGMPQSGAMDRFAQRLANILVGNDADAEVLECTLLGPKLRFHQANIFAICGGDFSPKLDGQSIERNRAYVAPAGSVLELAAAKSGARCYLAFHGGLAVDEEMGSKSTYIKGGIGGIHGRAAQNGDQVAFLAPTTQLPHLAERAVALDFGVRYMAAPTLRVVLGPQDDRFSTAGKQTLFHEAYQVSAENDRMGYRLDGPEIEAAPGCDGNIISDGIAFGSIQVPSGKPIIMMADRQTVGGYAKIASVAAVDLPLLAQLKTGDTVRFCEVSIEEAQRLYREQCQLLQQLAERLAASEAAQAAGHGRARQCVVHINGQRFEVTIEEIG